MAGGGSFGALRTTVSSQVAFDSTETVVDTYRWGVRENGSGFDLRLSASKALKPGLELGLEFGAMPDAITEYVGRYTYSAESNGYISTHSNVLLDSGIHLQGAARARFQLVRAGGTRFYLGLGAGVWYSPTIDLQDPEAGTHEAFGPFIRPFVEPSLGLQFLLGKKAYLGVDAFSLVDVSPDPLIERNAGSTGLIPIGSLEQTPPARRAVLGGRLGVGFLF